MNSKKKTPENESHNEGNSRKNIDGDRGECC